MENDNLNAGRIVPVYALCENLNIKALRKAVANALSDYGNQIKNVVPDDIREKFSLPDKIKALEAIHRVQDGLDSQISGDFLSQDIRECIFFISDIAGEVTNDMVLQNIFQHFCIGK